LPNDLETKPIPSDLSLHSLKICTDSEPTAQNC
jgi:hypothetical protein